MEVEEHHFLSKREKNNENEFPDLPKMRQKCRKCDQSLVAVGGIHEIFYRHRC